MGRTTHGHYRNDTPSPTYVSWHTMNARCEQPFRTDARWYTSKGIEVCERWRRGTPNAFLNFLEDMGERPAGTTLGRLDQDRGYVKENCAWQSPRQQSLATGRLQSRGKHILTWDGVTMTYEEWAEYLKIDYRTLLRRLGRGWTIEEICSTPRGRFRRTVAREQAMRRSNVSEETGHARSS